MATLGPADPADVDEDRPGWRVMQPGAPSRPPTVKYVVVGLVLVALAFAMVSWAMRTMLKDDPAASSTAAEGIARTFLDAATARDVATAKSTLCAADRDEVDTNLAGGSGSWSGARYRITGSDMLDKDATVHVALALGAPGSELALDLIVARAADDAHCIKDIVPVATP